MLKKNLLLIIVLFAISGFSQTNDSIVLKSISDEILTNGKCYDWLNYLTSKIGHRLSGSKQANEAVEYTKLLMKNLNLDTVYLQECKVPHWVRGEKETAKIIYADKKTQEVPILALGGSIETPKLGITAEVIEIRHLSELSELGKNKITGKIVFFNRAFDEKEVDTFNAYGKAVDQRWAGPSEAAKYGAIATIVRSMTNSLNDFPHTGSMVYKDSIVKIPCCAISTNGANLLSSSLNKDPQLKFNFKMSCKTLPDEISYNVIGEIKGTVYPEEIVVVGGHLDSWDVGTGANDDGAGSMQSIEVLRTIKALGIKPKRTIRAVLFMNEENGLRGGKKYAEVAKLKNEKHIAAIETDAGSFSPRGFSIDANTIEKKKVMEWKNLFLPYGVYDFSKIGGGAEIEPLKDQGVALMELLPDSQRYFEYHHTNIDTFDKVNKRELSLGAAALTMMTYLLSEYGL